MKNEEFLLLSDYERAELKKAYLLIKQVKEKIDYEYEEYFAIQSSLDYLNNAINFKVKFLS